MPKHCLSIGLMALAAAVVVLPAKAQAEHENRYFGFSYQPYYHANPYARPYVRPYAYPEVYYPPRRAYPRPPRMRQIAPNVFEYEVAPGVWARGRPGYGSPPPRQRARGRPQAEEARRSPAPPPVPKTKPDDAMDQPLAAARSAPATVSPAQQAPALSSGGAISCEAAADIIRDFGFSDVQSTSCSGDVYNFDAARDGSAYSIKLSAADGELTEVRRR